MSAGDLAERCKRIEAQIDTVLHLPRCGAWPAVRHRLDRDPARAIIAALAAGRPLLVRGEPGIGKSQLARAAAHLLERQFLAAVVQPDSEYQELLWAMDHTARLADAQLSQAERVRQVRHYIGPGALWWALDWHGAAGQFDVCPYNFEPPADADPERARGAGCVLLIDEIDKADIALANGLLEVLGNRQFAVPPLGLTVPDPDRAQPAPLVVLTSNDTRQLPAALLRRCVVLLMALDADPDKLRDHVIERGETHFPRMHAEVLAQAADLILRDRAACSGTARTGLAEYLDLLTALDEVDKDSDTQLAWLDKLGGYFGKSDAP
jgi:MoxR-like ATPase